MKYPMAGDLAKGAGNQLTSNPEENPHHVYSDDGGLEGVFADESDAEGYADELRRSGARNVRVEKQLRMHPRFRKANPDGPDDELELACPCHRHNPDGVEPGATCEMPDYDIVICDEGDPALEDEGLEPNGEWAPGEIPTLASLKTHIRQAIYWVNHGMVKQEGERGIRGVNAATVTGWLRELPIKYNARLTKAIARCIYKRSWKPGTQQVMVTPVRIELSVIDIPGDQKHQILVHEYCHAAIGFRNGISGNHDQIWKDLMVASGAKPDVFMSDERINRQLAARRDGTDRARIPREPKGAGSPGAKRKLGSSKPTPPPSRTAGGGWGETPRPGDKIVFKGDGNKAVRGVVKIVNDKAALVMADGKQWMVYPDDVIKIDRPQLGELPGKPTRMPEKGEVVKFRGADGPMEGEVIRVNPSWFVVDAKGWEWKVFPEALIEILG